MSKLAVLKLGDGSFEQGFPVTLQLGDDGKAPAIEITGKLPPDPEIPLRYKHWRVAYRHLGVRYRLGTKTAFVTNVSKIEDCNSAAEILRDRLNTWLHSESFCPIREKLLEQLMPSDEVRLLVQTECIGLRRLPWHLWDLCDRYPKAEIALSATVYERVEHPEPTAKVRILAILGNSAGIDIQTDRMLLEQLPNAEITFLVEPQREELNEQLWKQGWDILFFAGHSSSQENGETGKIYINQTDSLTVEQLKYALKKAVGRGLKIAIFNSCDGLGLAGDLASLQISQIIVMREPVPDKVAQEFLKFFLEAFARGESFYLAVREARERLQGLESQFPGATWLPMISQIPAVVPPTWKDLWRESGKVPPHPPSPPPDRRTPEPPQIRRRSLRAVFIASVVVTSAIWGIRHLGMFQTWELQAFDQSLRLRPAEQPDPRLLVVAVTEEDFQLKEQQHRIGSLSDLALAKLLEKLAQFKPRSIGLDIYRDFPVDPKQPALATAMQRNYSFFAICKVSDRQVKYPGVAPPPEIPTDRLGFSDFVVDSDGIIRRHLIAMNPSSTSPCTAPYALSARLAFRYLEAEGISAKYTQKDELQLGEVVFKRWHNHMGGYQQLDDWGYQILLNYRSYHSPEEVVEQVTLKDVLAGKINPDTVKDRIVLIGVTAQSVGDYFPTPYSANRGLYQEMPGVIIHAQMVSQILSAVLDKRPLLWVMPFWGEALWIWGWSALGGILAWRIRNPWRLGLAGGVAVGVLYVISLGAIAQGFWVPLVPSALALVVTGVSVLVSASPVQSQPDFSIATNEP